MPDAPPTDEGWYVLHDFRTVDWDAWRDADEAVRDAAIADGREFYGSVVNGDGETGAGDGRDDDGRDGDGALFAVLGNDADLLLMLLRPTLTALECAARRFEQTAFAGFTERASSFVSVTEVSGYVSQAYFEDGEDVDPGLRGYVESKLSPSIPDGYVSFYPMSKRRDPGANWYELSFEERAELMAAHGETGRDHAGEIRQVITSCLGFDDAEWGVTLFSDDPAAIKDVVYDMRFDESSARYAEFGPFSVGRRFPPADLGAYVAGEPVPVADHGDTSPAKERDGAEGDAPSDDAHGGPPAGVRTELDDRDVYAGQPHGEDVHARVVYSTAVPDELAAAADDLRESFDHYDTHLGTDVYENPDGGPAAVASRWETEHAADIAAGFLADLPGVEGSAEDAPTPPGTPDGGAEQAAGAAADEAADDEAGVDEAVAADGWGTMGMFYTVKPEHREAFVEKFDEVGGLLEGMDGHRRTDLLVNRANADDMFIASRWDSREDAMAFFRSDAFQETVTWGRDVLADRPRHVFLA